MILPTTLIGNTKVFIIMAQGGQHRINEEVIQSFILNVLNEETKKITRQDYQRAQFKIDELMSSLRESIKEINKLNEQLPIGLRVIAKNKMTKLSSSLEDAKQATYELSAKLKEHKTKSFSTKSNTEEKD